MAMNNSLDRFFGGPPVRTVIWLAFLSVVIGFVLATFGLDPFTLVRKIVRGFDEIIDSILWLGTGLFSNIGHYLVYGAIVVVPIWVLMRLMALGRGRS
jgi:cytochrome bd-type quinol oxidase subunit 1